jgi:hypothetical protein
LIEVRPRIDQSDVSTFVRKAKHYEKRASRRPDRLLIVTPFIDPDALEAARGARNRGLHEGLSERCAE